MSLKLLGGGSDLNTVVNDVNQNILELKNREVTEIFKDDNGTPVVILDKNGLRTTDPGSGIDVTEATDSQYTFNSSRNTLKIVGSGSYTLSFPALADGGVGVWSNAHGVASVAHGLSYAPILIAYYSDGSFYYPLTYIALSNGGATSMITQTYSAYVDTTNITFDYFAVGLHSSSPAGSIPIKYYLLQETAN